MHVLKFEVCFPGEISELRLLLLSTPHLFSNIRCVSASNFLRKGTVLLLGVRPTCTDEPVCIECPFTYSEYKYPHANNRRTAPALLPAAIRNRTNPGVAGAIGGGGDDGASTTTSRASTTGRDTSETLSRSLALAGVVTFCAREL